LYVVEEITSAATLLMWDAGPGTLREVQTLSALPPDFAGENTSAEILMHPRGRFVYVSNRGHDSVAVFAADQGTGRLTLVQHVPSGGRTPRYMAFDLTGEWLLVTNHDSDTAAIFSIDEATGRLRPHGTPVSVHRPFGLSLVRA
jgi:6-phosphogluconolactonase